MVTEWTGPYIWGTDFCGVCCRVSALVSFVVTLWRCGFLLTNSVLCVQGTVSKSSFSGCQMRFHMYTSLLLRNVFRLPWLQNASCNQMKLNRKSRRSVVSHEWLLHKYLKQWWAISYTVALADVIRMLNSLFCVSGLATALKPEGETTSVLKLRHGTSFALRHESQFFFHRSVSIDLKMNKKEVGGKKLESKIEDNLEISVWLCGEKDSGAGMGNTCKRREVSVDMEVFWSFDLYGETPVVKTVLRCRDKHSSWSWVSSNKFLNHGLYPRGK